MGYIQYLYQFQKEIIIFYTGHQYNDWCTKMAIYLLKIQHNQMCSKWRGLTTLWSNCTYINKNNNQQQIFSNKEYVSCRAEKTLRDQILHQQQKRQIDEINMETWLGKLNILQKLLLYIYFKLSGDEGARYTY